MSPCVYQGCPASGTTSVATLLATLICTSLPVVHKVVVGRSILDKPSDVTVTQKLERCFRDGITWMGNTNAMAYVLRVSVDKALIADSR